METLIFKFRTLKRFYAVFFRNVSSSSFLVSYTRREKKKKTYVYETRKEEEDVGVDETRKEEEDTSRYGNKAQYFLYLLL